MSRLSELARRVRSHRLVGAVVRWRVTILLVASVAAGVADASLPMADWWLFAGAGETLLSPAWRETFADPSLQAGPLYLAAAALLVRASEALAVDPPLVFSLSTYLAAVALSVVAVRATLGAGGVEDRPGAELIVGALVLAWGLASDALLSGHPAQVVVPALWCIAGAASYRGMPVAAGLLVAATAGIETWGILGGVVLLLSPTLRGRLIGGASLVGGVALLFASFVLFGEVATGDYVWAVHPGSPVALVLGADVRYTWAGRVLQALFAVIGGAALAGLTRGRWVPGRIWTVALVTVLLRLLVDPLIYDYYWVAPRLLAIGGVATAASSDARSGVLLALGGYALFLTGFVPYTLVLAVALPAAIASLFLAPPTHARLAG